LSTAKDVATLKILIDIPIDDIGQTIETLEDLDDYLCNDWGCNTIPEYFEMGGSKTLYNNAVAALRKGKKLIVGRVSNEGDGEIDYYLYNKGFTGVKNASIIQDAQG
jgi:hypothetical protein